MNKKLLEEVEKLLDLKAHDLYFGNINAKDLAKQILSDERLSKGVDNEQMIEDTYNYITNSLINMGAEMPNNYTGIGTSGNADHAIKYLSQKIVQNILSTVAPEDKWISVEDELPNCFEEGNWDGKFSDYVLCMNKYHRQYVVRLQHGFLDGSSFSDWWQGQYNIITNVTHWMPLPQPPTPHNPSKEGE